MKQEDIEFLRKDLCARLPYQTMILTPEGDMELEHAAMWTETVNGYLVEDIKPYLRPMSSMTEEEEKEYKHTCSDWYETLETYDWLNANHFDYRGLIKKGLALEAPKDMYNIK